MTGKVAAMVAAIRSGPTHPSSPSRRHAEQTPVVGLKELLDGATDLLLVTDDEGMVTYASARAHELVDVPPDRLLRRHVTEIAAHDDRARLVDLTRQAHEAQLGRWLRVEFAVLLASGDTRMVEADVTALDRSPNPRGLVWAIRELGPHHAHDLSADNPLRDRLTGLPNRAMLAETLTLTLARADRVHSRLAAVIVGVEEFRHTWETVGRRAAEELLLSAAGRLESVVRPGDLVARTGVEEFTLLLDGFQDVDEVLTLTRAALASLAEPVEAGSQRLSMGASAGIALARDGIGGCEGLLEQASLAMQHAREESPGVGVLYEPSMTSRGRRGRDLTADLDRAIRAGQLRPVFQPMIDLQTGRISGFEALARWDHPERGPISPATFITLAEETGLIVELGRSILVSACKQMEAWRHAYPEQRLRVAVNVSPHQLIRGPLVDHVREALSLSGLAADQLVLEITESAVHQDVAAVQHVLGRLHDLGVQTAMDDFGTGFSSLAYLRRLPLDVLKIDKAFLDDREGTGPQLLAAVIGIGRQLGMTTVAEGIEDSEQLEAVCSAGCTFGQGFLISRPLEVEAATRLVGLRGPIWTPHRTPGSPDIAGGLSAS